jgi:hypothetical protein
VIATGPGAIAGEILGLAAMAGGVWLVAHRAPRVAAEQPEEDGGDAVSRPAAAGSR